MKKGMLTILMTALLTAFFLPGAHAAGMPANFSADVVTTTARGTMNMKMYTSGDKSRMEMAESLMIVRRDLGVMWMVMPTQSMYMEQPIDMAMVARTSVEMPGELSREPLGSETIDGKAAQKFKVTYSAAGHEDSIYQWIGGDNFPVRTAAVDGSWTVDFKNVSSAPVDAGLFEVPAGFRKIAIPSMKNLIAAAPQQQE